VEDKIARYRKYLVITALIYSAILVSVGLIIGWAADHVRIGAAEDLYHRAVHEFRGRIRLQLTLHTSF